MKRKLRKHIYPKVQEFYKQLRMQISSSPKHEKITKENIKKIIAEELREELTSEIFGFGSSKGAEKVEDIHIKIREMLERAVNSIDDMNRQSQAVGAVASVVEQAIMHAAGIQGGSEQRLRAMYERLGRAIDAQVRGNSKR